ncbi:MAG: winged helix-turn-helix transcriptional regulator [Candidatus Aenigmarchaeota archaeon]|nr:winged helix-turn-helix transcriptional regulator [Candidatus Aenigmarchaeota archaeon]
MPASKESVIRLLGKKYTYGMLKSLEKGPKRFKGLEDICRIEKMRAHRLRELRSLDLIQARAKRVDGRAVSLYSLSEKGKSILRLAEDIKKLEADKS